MVKDIQAARRDASRRLDPTALLDDYAAIARRRAKALEWTALRTKSRRMRDLLAHLASNGELDFAQIAAGQMPREMDARWCAALGRVVGLQGLDPDDAALAIRILSSATPELSVQLGLPYRKLLAELRYQRGEFVDVHAMLADDDHLRGVDHGYLAVDLLNPFRATPYADRNAWEEGLAYLFESHGLVAPSLDDDEEALPFDRLTTGAMPIMVGPQPKVSVIVTTYRPKAGALLASLRSMLRQTWSNLEVILVDDGSPKEFVPVLEQAASLDERVRLIRLPTNVGTYRARNAGLQAVAGDYVTGQDDDDWSHPERLARQVAALLSTSDAAATWSMSLCAAPDLVIQRPGYRAYQPNASSLLIRSADLDLVGGYLPARRGADTEFRVRLERVTDRAAVLLPEPLAIIRITDSSLSRSDFSAGWQHPARGAFRHAYQRWHATSARDQLKIDLAAAEVPIPLPAAFRVEPTHGPAHFDVVFAGDWRRFGGPQRSMLAEIAAVRRLDLRVGIVHLEATRFMTQENQPLCAPVQALINAGEVTRVLADDDADVELLILRYPPILQFPPLDRTSLRIRKMIMLANQAPSEADGRDVRYRVADVSRHAKEIFGVDPLWVPQGPLVREMIQHDVTPGCLADFDMPGIIDADSWITERASFRSDRPVIGRHSRDDYIKWPDDPSTLLTVYPTDGSVEVRIMGGTRVATDVLGGPTPPSWLAFAADELDVRTFLNSLDFFVYYDHPYVLEAFGRVILEALAAGCVVILPSRYQPVFGDAAVYAAPQHVPRVIREFYADRDRYSTQSRRAVARVRKKYSYDSYCGLVSSLVETSRANG